MANASRTTKDCKACGARIPKVAKLCNKCGSYQKLRIGPVVVATLAAIGSVGWIGTIAFPHILKAFHHPESQLTLTNPNLREDTLYVTATNRGDLPATVKEGVIKNNGALFGSLDVTSAGNTIVRPGSKLISLHVAFNNAGETQLRVGYEPKPQAVAYILTIGSDGKERAFALPIDPYQFTSMRLGTAARCEQAKAGTDAARGCGDMAAGRKPSPQ